MSCPALPLLLTRTPVQTFLLAFLLTFLVIPSLVLCPPPAPVAPVDSPTVTTLLHLSLASSCCTISWPDTHHSTPRVDGTFSRVERVSPLPLCVCCFGRAWSSQSSPCQQLLPTAGDRNSTRLSKAGVNVLGTPLCLLLGNTLCVVPPRQPPATAHSTPTHPQRRSRPAPAHSCLLMRVRCPLLSPPKHTPVLLLLLLTWPEAGPARPVGLINGA